MRYFLALFSFLTLALLSAPAEAQFSWGQRLDTPWGRPLRTDSAVTGDWRPCTNDGDRYTPEQMIDGCTRLIEQRLGFDDEGTAYWWRAIAYERAGQADNAASDFASALAAYDEWREADPQIPDPYLSRASILVHLRQYDRALLEYANAERLRPRQPLIHAGRGKIAFMQQDYASAIAAFDRAARLENQSRTPGNFDAVRCEARAAAQVEIELARRICDRAVRETFAHPRSLVARGYFRFRQGDIDGAEDDFERALQRDPGNVAALYGRGVIYTRKGDVEAGERDIERARGLSTFSVEYYANAGLTP